MSKRRKPSYIASSWLAAEFILLPGRTREKQVDLQIKTADEFAAHDQESLWRVRRAARETAAFRRVLQLFVERGGPIPVEEIVAGLPDVGPEATRQALLALDPDDLIRIQNGKVDVAYPFTASSTAFVVRLYGGRGRIASSAVDALGIAPMRRLSIQVRTRFRHCAVPRK